MGDFVTWVLQANLLRRSKDDLAVCLKNLNIPFVGANVIPFSETLSFLSELPAHKRLIPCGSTSLLRYAQKARWQGVFFDANTFRVDTWLSQHPDMLNRAVRRRVKVIVDLPEVFSPEDVTHLAESLARRYPGVPFMDWVADMAPNQNGAALEQLFISRARRWAMAQGWHGIRGCGCPITRRPRSRVDKQIRTSKRID